MALVAVTLSSCGGTEGTDKQEVVVKYNGAEITEGQKITVSEFEVLGGKPTFAFKFVVTNNADKDIDMKLVETQLRLDKVFVGSMPHYLPTRR